MKRHLFFGHRHDHRGEPSYGMSSYNIRIDAESARIDCGRHAARFYDCHVSGQMVRAHWPGTGAVGQTAHPQRQAERG